MKLSPFLSALLCAALCTSLFVILFLAARLKRVKEQLLIIEEALEDIRSGNLNRRVLARKSDMTKRICFAVNETAVKSQEQLMKQKQAGEAYKRLMTSLSHDVKTPLSSLAGYLEAVEKGLVDGEEKEDYIRTAAAKARQLTHFVETLFEWVKLDAREQIFYFEPCDFNELTRHIAAEWIPALEQHGFEYDFDIPRNEYPFRTDSHAYTRILNNLFQNALTHSGGSRLSLKLLEEERQVQILVSDNGAGISPSDIPHIFERMYQCDRSRSAKGNGLGLSITEELVHALGGTIKADSTPGMGTIFTILFPKAL